MVQYPHELFRELPTDEADKIRKQLIAIYFEDHPEDMQDIIEGAEGHPDLIAVGQDEKINEVMSVDYGFSVEILNSRDDDRIAELLVEEIDRFNQAGKGQEITEDISVVGKKVEADISDTHSIGGFFDYEYAGNIYEIQYSVDTNGDERGKDEVEVEPIDMPAEIYDKVWEDLEEMAIDAAYKQLNKETQ